MDRPGVYIETSIVSYLAARPSRDPVTLRNQQLTHAWWETQRERYALYTSEFVLAEAEQGDPLMAKRRLALLAPITLLASHEHMRIFAHALRKRVPLPDQANEDALHIATATVNAVDYLLTWNCKHIANPQLRQGIERICTSWGYKMPVLCTPRDLMEG